MHATHLVNLWVYLGVAGARKEDRKLKAHEQRRNKWESGPKPPEITCGLFLRFIVDIKEIYHKGYERDANYNQ